SLLRLARPVRSVERRGGRHRSLPDLVGRFIEMTEPRGDRQMKATARWLLTAAASIVLVLTVVRVFVFGPAQAFLDQVSGVWTALAVDLSSGVFYRTVASPEGF